MFFARFFSLILVFFIMDRVFENVECCLATKIPVMCVVGGFWGLSFKSIGKHRQ